MSVYLDWQLIDYFCANIKTEFGAADQLLRARPSGKQINGH
jgi:hypothetical protein